MRFEMVEVAPGIQHAVEMDGCPECGVELPVIELGRHGLCRDCEQYTWDDDEDW